MKAFFRYRNSILVTAMIFFGALMFTQCINKDAAKSVKERKIDYSQFAGSASCSNCHKEICNSHVNTAHYLTSGIADAKSIRGSFEPGKNSFDFALNASVAMEKRNNAFYQVEYFEGNEKLAKKFDVVVGSGTKGQTYLNWDNNRLFQLPITYFTATAQWCNSPGYPGRVAFNRPVTSRCMECHSTYATILSEPGKEPELFDRSKMIYGVDCEKCHGPAAEHVAYQAKNPTDTTAKFIVNPSKLSRQQNLDMCALCHGGRLQKTKPSFSFMAGDSLAAFFKTSTAPQFASEIDVHGNQYGLMAASKCFMQSKTMTCNSCHNSHINEAGQTKVFSQRCISCHTTEHVNTCKMTDTIGSTISNNCIDCHMPVEQSRAIVVLLPGKDAPTPAKMRSHYIKVYPNETKKFIEKMKVTPAKK